MLSKYAPSKWESEKRDLQSGGEEDRKRGDEEEWEMRRSSKDWIHRDPILLLLRLGPLTSTSIGSNINLFALCKSQVCYKYSKGFKAFIVDFTGGGWVVVSQWQDLEMCHYRWRQCLCLSLSHLQSLSPLFQFLFYINFFYYT